MNSKYKILKYRGFNPFRTNESRQLSQIIGRGPAELQKLKARSKLNMKEIALILQNNQEASEANEQTQNKQTPFVQTQNYELHQYTQSQGQNQRKNVVMFNQRQFCKKTFDQVFTSNKLHKQANEFHGKILSLEKQNCSKQNSRLIIYLANSIQTSEKVILGHNQTQSSSEENSTSQCLLEAIYQKMLSEKTHTSSQKPSFIYFSAIGIEKENNMYDILNQNNIYKDSEISSTKVPQVKIRKILRQHDSIIAENLKKQAIKDKNHLKELIEKSKEIKNFIQFYENFNESFFLCELYHFYEANADYDLFNECVVLKVNQHFPKLSASTLADGFYQRQTIESNASRIATLIMRIGLNIKACRKNKLNREALISLPKKMSRVQMHQSKILLYLGPIFMNLNTHYVLINQVGAGDTISDEIKKIELNRGFRPEAHPVYFRLASFYHTKHFLDIPQVQEIVKKLGFRYIGHENVEKLDFQVSINNPKRRISQNSGRTSNPLQTKLQQSQQQNGQQKQLEQQKRKRFSHTQTNRTYQTETKRRKSLLREGERVKSKSFFCHTISSSERNYWKSVERDYKQLGGIINIGKLLYDQEKMEGDSKMMKSSKTINAKTEGLKFIDEESLVKRSLQGVRVTYKRKLVVRAVSSNDPLHMGINKSEH